MATGDVELCHRNEYLCWEAIKLTERFVKTYLKYDMA